VTQQWCCWPFGIRAAELVDLRGEQVDLENAILHVRRVKQGTPATHPLTGRELRALRRLQREQGSKSPFVFVSERGTPFSKRGFQAMVERAARAAGFDMKIHPHMLRHSCGYKLANDGVDTRTIQSYFGHKSIQCTPSGTPSWRRRALRAYFEISCNLMTHRGPLVGFSAQSGFGRAMRSTHHGAFLSHCEPCLHTAKRCRHMCELGPRGVYCVPALAFL
jgi:hypothetical protein